MQVKFSAPTGAGDVRSALHAMTLHGMTIQQVGEAGDEFLVRVQESSEKLETLASGILATLEKQYGSGKVEIRRTEMVGPQVGKELRSKAVWAVIY
ncbi:protein translocase subunit SecF, partial [bacterium]|nr:protein translocase subunit SecF [bacterium]